MSDFIGIDIIGAKELAAKLKKLPAAVIDAGADEAYKYLLGIVKTYPPKKYVSRAQAYPYLRAISPHGVTIPGFASWAQFKFVMALWGKGQVPYTRSQDMARNWKIIGKGKSAFLANDTAYGHFLMDDYQQLNQPKLIGWKTVGAILKECEKGVVTKFEAGMKKGAAKVGIEMK